ncbi:deleted in malignant brain tumors 1 protein-like isoform X2 [Trematomus bernacchii]|uniref:deleted in malignant brain tumors 1 protein-like isoform X2 n=1 Tax=Trematomus bernacchii TaxID=40690 RepID=UPI00146DE43B|nr:deleted in malignant brain tumors 1 protein-like isoform X2 [Trematomus bernacchii]
MGSKQQRNLHRLVIDGQIRLAGSGSNNCSGRVEIYHSSTWGTVCDDNWDLNDAQVVCRQLGCGSALKAPREAHYDQVRLAGSGSNNCSGRVEIFHNSTWGTVCDDNWDLDDAQVVCRQLGCGSALRAPHSAHYGEGTGPIWLGMVGCSGSESSVTECTHPGFGTHNCSHSEDAGVVCSVPQQKPTLSLMSPSGGALMGSDGPEVIWGQSVSITCFASTLPRQLFSNTKFILEKTSSSFRESRTPGSSSASFSIQEVNLDHEGWYRCQYQIRVSGRNFSSPFSDSVRLSVSVPLQQPNISVTSPSGGLFWSPEGAEVTRGHSFLLTCSIAPQYPGGFFSLLFSGSRVNVLRRAVNHSASFSFPAAGPEQQGNYSCLYEVTLSSRTFTSTQEAPITVIITFPVMVLVSSVCGGGLLLVLLVLGGVFFFFLIRRRRPGDLNQTPMRLGAMKFNKEDKQNIYVHFDGDETETR